ncbi:SDR family NAD(P)-dependent oxidoreductase [Actinomadura macrotermitis]|uniref:3-phenylpropionate-dihydrodiol/cinnamic acid-dihydrodiol dehydrogenase n=1 Tax=Actinomadura macrotermitis TaxID=2585200 RepID=A0A7K0C5M2_9ACTN|nr:SDR family oxidoreductase [Actinomadura macrotermitis]MQY08412.1 3-phenylpropionate-dihydrodiol/cinnamic acid-dihydrodiol dehydrogenase [Actinomadura macrotermitis]
MSIAIVTGGASGIGRAIATSLVARGDTVVVTDINAAGAQAVADKLNTLGKGKATAAALDVTDADAVADLFTGVKAEHGRLDLVFNNAGISIGGAAEELTLAHWDRAIDINLKGVVHGVHAAYPIMLEQRSGHIVNTASLAGLVPMPLGIPYTATKHAVVGLSLGLRAEAAGRGVKVSVVCPSFVDTPLLTNVNPDLPATSMSGDAKDDIQKAAPRLYTAEKLAADIMRGVDRNKALIVAPAHGRAAWRGVRLNPGAATRVAGLAVSRIRSGK